jgi:murein DD-endopeptidase MepM/ murein hydrolase activator NlpD
VTLALLLLASVFTIGPEKVKQGGVIRIETKEAGAFTARMGERRVRLFPDADGGQLGLMPVAADAAAGFTQVVVEDAEGSVVTEARVEVMDARFPVQNIRVTPGVQALRAAPGEMEAIREFQGTVSESRYWRTPFRQPVPGCLISPFGVQRHHNGKPTGNYHRGIDQRAAVGVPVRAPAAGLVRLAKMYRLHGGSVGLDHGHGVATIHIHLSKLSVKPGDRVAAGDVIGVAGATGFATGPHLHWGLYVHGVPVNPLDWIPAVPRCAAK